MGIENRDYLKNDEGFDAYSVSGSRRKHMSVVHKLIIATAAVFVLQLMTGKGNGQSLVMSWLSLDSDTVFFKGQVWRLLSYAFCHSQLDLLHIVINMYILYIIAPIVCQLTGEREFLWFYLASAVCAGICSVAFYTAIGLEFQVIGASGAVMAVFMLFALHYPRQKMYLLGAIPIEVRWLLAVYIALDVLPVVRMLTGDPHRIVAEAIQQNRPLTAHSAHLGGLFFGFLYFRWNMRLTNWWDRFAGRMPNFRARRKNLKVFSPPVQPESDISQKVDEILAKISQEGEASLTVRERNILTQASRQLRKDRDS